MRVIPAGGLTLAGGLGSGDLFQTSSQLGFVFDARLSDGTTGSFNSLDSAGRSGPDLQGQLGLQFAFTEETHASCPGHAGFVYSNHPSTMVIRWVCLTPAEHPETKSAAEIEAEQKRDEERRAFEESRAAAIANQTARREWIKGLLAGKLDKLAGLHTYLASAFLTEDSSAEPRVTAQLLDIELPAGLPTWQQSDAATEAISEVVIAGRVPPLKLLLAAALAVHEEADDYYPRFTVAHYQHIEKWGYKLTDLDVERRDKAVRELAAQAESDAAEDATEEEVA